MGLLRQFKAIAKKNILIQKRNFCSVTFWRLVWPLISGLLMSLFTMPAGYNQWQTGMDTERPPNATENIQRLVIIYLLIIFLNVTTYASPCSFILG